MNKKLWFLAVFLFFFVVAKQVSAHQPNYVDKQITIADNEPEISKAYYGELTGTPAEYTIISKNNFSMYASILSPDIVGAQKNYQVQILDSSNTVVATLNNPLVTWQHWYETFGGDWYWQGPEFKQDFPGGTYKVVVTNANNKGKYVLAIGEVESFPVSKTLHTVSELYKTKTEFFGKPWYSIFGGAIGKGLLVFVLLVFFTGCFIIWLLQRRIVKNQNRK